MLSRIPLLVAALAVAAELAGILAVAGRFGYTLDDAYIHLALSERLARGHYGLNADEPSSPSSSILFPALLAPFAPLGAIHEWVPLLLNTAALLGTVALLLIALRRAGLEGPFASGLVILITASLNLVGLAFTGMEHSLHVLVTVVVVVGLQVLLQDGRVPGWLLAAIILGPLLRYEGLAVSLGAVLVLALCRQWRAAAVAGVVCALTLGSFSAFLLSLGLPALPSSVLVKSDAAARGVDAGLWSALRPLARNLVRPATSALFLAFLGAGAVGRLLATRERRVRWPALCLTLFALTVIGSHLAIGRYGSYARYEIYAVVAVVVTCLALWGSTLQVLVDRIGWRLALAAATVVTVLFPGLHYAHATFSTPSAARNIYEQQYQMHRFVTEYHRVPVAVNDLGWVAYRNPVYVLDLVGLASEPARQAKSRGDRAAWPPELLDAHGVGVAMVYDEWVTPPSSWRRVATLHLGSRPVVVRPSVAFYATERDGAVEEQLRRFKATLPVGVHLDVPSR